MHKKACKSVFVQNIRYLRQSHGMTQKQMADILGISVRTESKMERGEEVRLNSGMLCRVCDAFDISSDAMLRGELENVGK